MRLAALLAVAFYLPAWAQDAARGKLLYEAHCNECHYVRVHQRLRSEVKDIADLRDVVWRRSRETKKRSFSVEELDDITAYLNNSYYRFGEAAKKPQ